MKPERWLALILIALALAWWLGRTHTAEPAPELSLAATAAPAATDSAVVDLFALSEAAARVPQTAEEGAQATAPFTPPTVLPSSPATAGLHGLVLPIEGAGKLESPVSLSLTDRHGEVQRTEAGSDGAYSFAGLESGRYWIRAGRRTAGEVRRVIEFDASLGDRRLDLQLQGSQQVQVEVVDAAGAPLSLMYLFAVATIDPPGAWCETFGGPSPASAAGVWEHEDSEDPSVPASVLGRVRLKLPPPVFISILYSQQVLATQRLEIGQDRVRFVLHRDAPSLQQGRLRFRLIDDLSRRPLGGYAFQLLKFGALYPRHTDADGTFSELVSPGWLSVKSGAPSYEAMELTLRIEAGQELDLGDIALSGPVSVAGRVVDEQGMGVGRQFRYDVLDPNSGMPIDQGIGRRAHSSSDGSFRISGLARRRYRLLYEEDDGEWGMAALIVDARSGSVEGARMVLARGIPLVLSSSDERWPLLSYEIFDAECKLLRARPLGGPEPRKILLAPGRYAIDVRVGEMGEAVRREFTIGTEPVELSLP